METHIDHLVIAAKTLEQGVEYIKDTLGVNIPFGGVHPKMGTHNHLMQLGSDIFLEIISINPEAPAPERPRWFGLDSPHIKTQLADSPRLLTWVVNTTDINSIVKNASFDAGTPEIITRGALSWYFALPENGSLLFGGAVPYAIQWLTEEHPSKKMADMNCRLESLEIFHPQPDNLRTQLGSVGADKLVKIKASNENSEPHLKAHIKTPKGIKQL